MNQLRPESHKKHRVETGWLVLSLCLPQLHGDAVLQSIEYLDSSSYSHRLFIHYKTERQQKLKDNNGIVDKPPVFSHKGDRI
jgi:hypothetical protein